jgi:hypothetical protein
MVRRLPLGGQVNSKTLCFADLPPGMRALFAVRKRVILAARFDIPDQRQFGTTPQSPSIDVAEHGALTFRAILTPYGATGS